MLSGENQFYKIKAYLKLSVWCTTLHSHMLLYFHAPKVHFTEKSTCEGGCPSHKRRWYTHGKISNKSATRVNIFIFNSCHPRNTCGEYTYNFSFFVKLVLYEHYCFWQVNKKQGIRPFSAILLTDFNKYDIIC